MTVKFNVSPDTAAPLPLTNLTTIGAVKALFAQVDYPSPDTIDKIRAFVAFASGVPAIKYQALFL